MGYKETRNEVALFIHSLVWLASIVCFVFKVDAEIIGCGTLTLLAIVSISILLSYLIEGREVVQSTVIDATLVREWKFDVKPKEWVIKSRRCGRVFLDKQKYDIQRHSSTASRLS